MKTSFKIALAGNPNCGKTSIFNALTGTRQHVGNYPGVTVESKSGFFTLNDLQIELIDLPGVYSLSSSSPEEEVVFNELTRDGIDLIVNVIDSTIPQRSLYLTTQLAELHIPMLLTFNMSDDAKKNGLKFDIPKLEKYFGSPIVQTVGNSSGGVAALLRKLETVLSELDDHGVPMLTYGADVDDAINAVSGEIEALDIKKYAHIPARFFAIKLLEHDSCVWRLEEFSSVHDTVEQQIRHLLDRHAIEADTFMADRRYAMLAGACRNTISVTRERRREISDKIDAFLTNKYLGFPIFLAIMYATFWFTFTVAEKPMEWIENFFAWLSEVLASVLPEGFISSLIIDGVIGGVGGVIVFLPNILLLFFAIAILEDSGYMSRASFVMDGIMRKFGLQGRSFVPLVLGFGCTVPAVMATRTIESGRDRTVTIMVLPLMSCGARLPIYALLIPAFFPEKYQAFTMWLIYLIGIVFALAAARIMKATLFKGEGEIYLMELPPYRMPTFKSMMLHMWDRSKMYLHKAGTIILFTSIILYFCNTYPEKKAFSCDYDAKIEEIRQTGALTSPQIRILEQSDLLDKDELAVVKAQKTIPQEVLDRLAEEKLSPAVRSAADAAQSLNDRITALENGKLNEQLEYTVSGRAGKLLEPVLAPMGFDWKISTAAIGALAAKEIFVAQLGILYSEGRADEESEGLRAVLRKHYTPLQAFCMMLFSLLSIPCLATLAIIRRELNSVKLAIAEGAGLFCLAWVVTTLVYQLGLLLNIGTVLLP